MQSNKIWYVLLGLVILTMAAVLAMPFIIFENIRQTTNRIVAPVEDINHQLRTQVSELMNPTPTIIPDPITIIHEVRTLARLETIQYTVEKIITAELGQDEFKFLFGDRLLFVAHGTVIAGIDLSRITVDDVQIKNGGLMIRLPEPEIFVASLDNEKSYIYDRQLGFLTRGDTDLETSARQAAEEEIRKSALEDGILEKARLNGELFLEKFFRNFGYDKVTFLQN